ncbi:MULTISPECIES: protein kinase [Thermoactinomyces]|uniref:Serine/threonine-protein kinase PrkC n=1 Tax=Thermoactinomyces daqus TaxID=1329516 RepID=A0A7W2AGQ1_9BACL|nr:MULTISPECIES: protein kinase [Thermoactinomyces]MBA4541891.1 serine/threonine protein kinase [Thermoactinomyces daqus]MBH8608035.1 serine/threonine protein kinase [Thermoactinomyces sp. CICC 10521]
MEGMRLAGRYEILHLLGGGGMAVVYKAKDLLLDRFVAVKVMNDSLGHDPDFVRRFIREAKAAGSLSHANVVSIYDVGREGDIFYMVMECVEGPSLIEVIRKEGTLTPEKTVMIASQICDALAHAHKNGIIHRDIKPHNILVSPDELYKVTDFGISYTPRASTITQKGYVMGSAHYFSPEQASGGEIHFSSDLYSLGIVIYEMLTGSVPFDGESSISVALKHIHDPVPDPRELNPRIPEELCQVIMKALEKDPLKRYQTAQEMKQALQQAVMIFNPPQHDYVSQVSQEIKQPPHRGRKYWLRGVAAVSGVLLLFLGYQAFGAGYLESDQPTNGSPVQAVQQGKQIPKEHGDHKWWKELPKESREENEAFRDIRVSGSNGNYKVTLKVGDFPEDTFYYDLFVVDSYSSQRVDQGISVHIKHKPDQRYTTKTVTVTIPEQHLPDWGIAKIMFYRLGENGRKIYATDNLLQMWGPLPKSVEEKRDRSSAL